MSRSIFFFAASLVLNATFACLGASATSTADVQQRVKQAIQKAPKDFIERHIERTGKQLLKTGETLLLLPLAAPIYGFPHHRESDTERQ